MIRVLLAGMFVTGCSFSDWPPPEGAGGDGSVYDPRPEMSFGRVRARDREERLFLFRNQADHGVTIRPGAIELPFTWAACCPEVTLAPGEVSPIVVAFQPIKPGRFERPASLLVDGAPRELLLRGEGVRLSCDLSVLDYGEVPRGAVVRRSIACVNESASAVKPRVRGVAGYPELFTVASAAEGALAPGAELTVTVELRADVEPGAQVVATLLFAEEGADLLAEVQLVAAVAP